MIKPAVRAALGIFSLVLAGFGHAQMLGEDGLRRPVELRAKVMSNDASRWGEEGASARHESFDSVRTVSRAAPSKHLEGLPVANSDGVVPGERIGAVARAALVEALSGQPAGYQLSLVTAPPGVPVPEGRLLLRAQPVRMTSRPAEKPATVWVDVVGEDRLLRSVAVQFLVSVKPIVAPPEGVARGRPVNPGVRFPVSMARVDIKPDGVGSATTPAAMPDAASVRALSGVVSPSIPEVSRGGSVQLILRTGSITLERVGTALANGRVGQFIPVRMPGVSTPLTGRVIAAGQVEILV